MFRANGLSASNSGAVAEVQSTGESGAVPAVTVYDEHTVEVDYDRGTQSLIEELKLHYLCGVVGPEHPKTLRSGSATITLCIVSFDTDLTTQGVLAAMERHGHRPAELPELLAFAVSHPDVALQISAVAIGSKYMEGCIDWAPFIRGQSAKFQLGVVSYEATWAMGSAFAVVPI